MRFPLSFAIALAALGVLTPSARLSAQPQLKPLPPDLMAPTDALSPEAERKQFVVPEGFEVQLVASEPNIQKPIQLAFDAKGRLWVTTSYHYPFAAQGKATDKLFVLSDFDPQTGKARKVQTFAEDLNIPIGILPLPDCKSCIVSSVGEIRKYTDTDGDGKADKVEVLFKGFGTRDTHGMYNSYTLMPDGWVYACHGFSNDSTVKGKDGHEVKLNSGNTFRFKPDGSRIEVWTRGQVNPFGMAVDPYWNLYTADCHSKPITQLIPGAYYQSFGKPHDGLGYAPHVTNHDHGSTALCGLTWYDADQFPKEYKDCMFLGNVVTNRINFDRIEWKGATPVAKEQPDFLTSKDRWFRPADIKLGPDGALYVADFYNKIIGHYEVDLKDPRRDKDRGRVWRIVWKGKDGKAPPAFAYSDLTATEPEFLAPLLGNPNLMVRMMATNECLRRELDEPLLKAITAVALKRPRAVPHFIWILERKGAFKKPNDMLVLGYLAIAGTKGEAGDIALPHNLLRPLVSRDRLSDDFRKLVRDLTEKMWERENPFRAPTSAEPWFVSLTARTYAEIAARHPHADFVKSLVTILKKCPADDTHLRQAAKIALRNCLRDDEKAWPPYKDEQAREKGFDPIYAEIAVAVPTGTAADYLLTQLQDGKIPQERLVASAEHIARHGDMNAWNDAITRFTNMAANPYSPVIGDALLGIFRAVQSRGKSIDTDTVNHILEAIGRQVGLPEPTAPLKGEDVQRITSAIRVLNALPTIASNWKSAKVPPAVVEGLAKCVERPNAPADMRAGAAEALLRIAPEQGIAALRKLVGDRKLPADFQERLLVALASSGNREARLDARDALQNLPYRLVVPVGIALAGTKEGAEDLLDAIRAGKAPARLLQEKAILERLKGSNAPDWQKRVADLTKNLPPADQRIADLLKARSVGFAKAKPDKAEGAKLFTKHCAACHKIGDVGGKIAPQLDGVGVRGHERLLEDILDPNRNVDAAFRARAITLKSEKTLTALMLRVEGQVLVVADLEGKEQRIPLNEIETNRETMLSAMPANFADVIPEQDLYHIVAYLLDQKQKEPPPKK